MVEIDKMVERIHSYNNKLCQSALAISASRASQVGFATRANRSELRKIASEHVLQQESSSGDQGIGEHGVGGGARALRRTKSALVNARTTDLLADGSSVTSKRSVSNESGGRSARGISHVRAVSRDLDITDPDLIFWTGIVGHHGHPWGFMRAFRKTQLFSEYRYSAEGEATNTRINDTQWWYVIRTW
jgi:hypothetical protein